MHPRHDQAVSTIAGRIADLHKARIPFRIFHGSTNSTRTIRFQKDHVVDISELNHVLSIDPVTLTAIVEPNVPMDVLVQATLRYGLVPPVVMEFPGITVGGGIQGGGGESSSFKWGCFNQTCNWYEIVLANGEVVRASRSEHADLFHGSAGSSGTLGVITAAEVQLIPAKKYVELTYSPVQSFSAATEGLIATARQDIDFLDGILFAKDSGVLIQGTLTDQVTGKLRRFSRAHDEWYYLHVERTLATQAGQGWTETVPLTDYLFRYDRGAFWVGRFAFDMFNVPYTRFSRWLLDPILHTRKLYQALQESGSAQRHIVQDIILPAHKVPRFLTAIDERLTIYPLWLCPLLPDPQAPFQLNHLPTDAIINVGVWGPEMPSHQSFMAANKYIEARVLELQGRKWSYAHSYFTRQQFWSIYDKQLYTNLRKRYHATTLPSLWDKLTVTKQYPINRKRAVLRTIAGIARIPVE